MDTIYSTAVKNYPKLLTICNGVIFIQRHSPWQLSQFINCLNFQEQCPRLKMGSDFLFWHESPSGVYSACTNIHVHCKSIILCKIGQWTKAEVCLRWAKPYVFGVISNHKNKFCHFLYAKSYTKCTHSSSVDLQAYMYHKR